MTLSCFELNEIQWKCDGGENKSIPTDCGSSNWSSLASGVQAKQVSLRDLEVKELFGFFFLLQCLGWCKSSMAVAVSQAKLFSYEFETVEEGRAGVFQGCCFFLSFFPWLPLQRFCKALVLWFVPLVMSDITFTLRSVLPRGSKNRATGSLRDGKAPPVPRM